MKLSALPGCVAPLLEQGTISVEGFAELCSALRLEGIDVFAKHVGGESEGERRRALTALRDRLAALNLVPAGYVVHNDFTHPADVENNLALIRRSITEGRALGAATIRVVGGKAHQSGARSREEGLHTVTEALRRVAPVAEDAGMVLALENHGDLPGRSRELKDIIEAVDSPNLRACCDIGNFIAGNVEEKEPPAEALRVLLPVLAAVHVKDRRFVPGARRDVENCVVGSGALPLDACMKLLAEHDFRGFVSCEFDGDSTVSHFTGALASIVALKVAVERAARV